MPLKANIMVVSDYRKNEARILKENFHVCTAVKRFDVIKNVVFVSKLNY